MVSYLHFMIIYNYLWVKESTIQVLVCTSERYSSVVVSILKLEVMPEKKNWDEDFCGYAWRACAHSGVCVSCKVGQVLRLKWRHLPCGCFSLVARQRFEGFEWFYLLLFQEP